MPAIVSTRGLSGRLGISTKTVRRRAEVMLVTTGHGSAQLSVLLCDDATMAELNGQYRQKPVPTDVLSFGMTGEPFDGGEAPEAPTYTTAGPELLGDVVISIPTASRQVGAGEKLRDEVTRLLAHGILHLLGWDHGTSDKLRAMERETERLIAAADRPGS